MQALQMSKYTAPPDAGGSWCKSQSVHIWLQVLWISSPWPQSFIHSLTTAPCCTSSKCCNCSQAGGTHIKRWSSRMVFRARLCKTWRFLSNYGADCTYTPTDVSMVAIVPGLEFQWHTWICFTQQLAAP